MAWGSLSHESIIHNMDYRTDVPDHVVEPLEACKVNHGYFLSFHWDPRGLSSLFPFYQKLEYDCPKSSFWLLVVHDVPSKSRWPEWVQQESWVDAHWVLPWKASAPTHIMNNIRWTGSVESLRGEKVPYSAQRVPGLRQTA